MRRSLFSPEPWATWNELDFCRDWSLVHVTKLNKTVPELSFLVQILSNFRLYLLEQFKPRKTHVLNIH